MMVLNQQQPWGHSASYALRNVIYTTPNSRLIIEVLLEWASLSWAYFSKDAQNLAEVLLRWASIFPFAFLVYHIKKNPRQLHHRVAAIMQHSLRPQKPCNENVREPDTNSLSTFVGDGAGDKMTSLMGGTDLRSIDPCTHPCNPPLLWQ